MAQNEVSGGGCVSKPAVGSLSARANNAQRPGEHDESHEDADGEEGDELDDRLGRDRQHQPVLMLGGVDVAGAEQHGERRHQQRDEQRDVAEQGLRHDAVRRRLREDGRDRGRHGFEL